jgi:hypothetical protein
MASVEGGVDCSDCGRHIHIVRFYAKGGEDPLCADCWESRYGKDGWDVDEEDDDLVGDEMAG